MGAVLRGLAAALYLVCVFSCAQAATPLRVVVPALPAQLDPHKAATPVDTAIAAELFLGLVTRDAMGNPTPGAAAWQVAPDGLSYVFTLRDGLTWSDGTRLTAEDFAAGLTRARDPATAAPFAADLAMIVDVTAEGRSTLKITLKQPSAAFLKSLSLPVAAPLPRHRVTALGAAWALPENIVVNGPFAVSGATLVANPRAVTPAQAPHMSFLTAASADDAATLIREGQADVSVGFAFENPVRGTAERGFQPDQGQSLYFVTVNTTRKPLSVREVRHALAMSIDRDGILKSLRLAGTDPTPAFSMVPPGAYGGSIPGRAAYAALTSDMRSAIAEVLLIESSIEAARPATFTLIYPPGAVHAAVAKNLAERWTPLGVRLTLQEQSAAAYQQSLRDGAFDLALGAWSTTDSDPAGYLAPFAAADDPRNPGRYAEADFATRLRDADMQIDPAQRLIMLNDTEAVLIQDQPILPIFFYTPLRPVAAGWNWQANVRGVHPLHLLNR